MRIMMLRMRTVMLTITVCKEKKEMMTTVMMMKDDDDHHDDDDEKAMQPPKPSGDCFRVGPAHQYHLKRRKTHCPHWQSLVILSA